ncbi:MAG: SHOCT domain-containing protein [Mycobacterium sp.]
MSGSRNVARLVLAGAIAALVVSVVGFLVTLLLYIFVWDEFDAYGEVPIPGTASLELPEGEVTVSFRTQVIGGAGGGLPIPPISLRIESPPGVPDPRVVEDIGATTTVNNDARVQVWVAQIPAAGSYRVTTDGNVSAFVSPRLAFGYGSTLGWLPVMFGVFFAISILDLLIALFWLARINARAAPPGEIHDDLDFADWDDLEEDGPVREQVSHEPSEDGIRIEQLKTLARLRDSGALTEKEFQSEKRRLLDGR